MLVLCWHWPPPWSDPTFDHPLGIGGHSWGIALAWFHFDSKKGQREPRSLGGSKLALSQAGCGDVLLFSLL
jgi:hypothetical protein